jgi:kinetochore protein NNF1
MDVDGPASSQRKSVGPRRSSLAPVPAWVNAPGSKRWLHFRAALRLTIERIARKWTYEDFALCFPLLCEAEPAEAGQAFDDVQQFMQTLMEVRPHPVSPFLPSGSRAPWQQNSATVFEEYGLPARMDDLYAIAQDANSRTDADEPYKGTDVWRPDLHPRTAARARTVPVLTEERNRLKKELEDLEAETAALQAQMQENVREKDIAQAEAGRILDGFDEVGHTAVPLFRC